MIEESLDSILREVAALKNLAQEFSSFAKLPEPKLETTSINDVVKSVLELYASSSQAVRIESCLSDSLPAVLADRDQMRSVLANLVKNAFEAMPSGGALRVTTALAPAGDWQGAGAAACSADDAAARGGPAANVRIEVSDSGAGIPPEIQDKIFNPYFTTKSSGSGIGLALAYRIVADHGGRIAFRTGATGTTFVIDLPVRSG